MVSINFISMYVGMFPYIVRAIRVATVISSGDCRVATVISSGDCRVATVSSGDCRVAWVLVPHSSFCWMGVVPVSLIYFQYLLIHSNYTDDLLLEDTLIIVLKMLLMNF